MRILWNDFSEQNAVADFGRTSLRHGAAHHHKGCGVAREDDVAKRRDATRARGVAKQRAVAKDQVASGRTIQVDEVATGDEGAEAIKADLTQADEVTTGIEVTEVKPDMTQGDNMTEVPDYSQAGKAQLDATTAVTPCATILQAIVAEATEYSKKSIDDRLAFVEKLLGAKSLETVIRIQSDYAKTSYEGFVEQTKKMGELYSDLAKAAFKPFDVASVQGTKQ
jgi:DNA-binding NtrC family response regulator